MKPIGTETVEKIAVVSKGVTTTSHHVVPSKVSRLALHTGNVFVERNKQAFALSVDSDATLLEVRRYASEVLMDLQAQSAAEYVTLRLAGIGKAKAEDEATPSA